MKEKISIAFIIDHLDLGGTESQILALLSRMNLSLFRPVVFCLKEKGRVAQKIEALGIEVKLVKVDYSFLPLVLNRLIMTFQLASLLKEYQVKVVQTYLLTANIFGTIAAKLAGVKVICAAERGLTTSDDQKQQPLRNFIFRLLSYQISKVVANSKMVSDYLLEKQKIPVEKTFVIHNGINTEKFNSLEESHELKKHLYERLNIPTQVKLVGIIARLVKPKNHQMLLSAIAKLKTEKTDFAVLLIGDGPLREELEVEVKKLKLEKVVYFLGNRSDIPGLLSILDLVVQTSDFEGLPNALMEAMAAKKAVLATNAGGTSELVIHNETGILVDCGDLNNFALKLKLLLENDTLRDKLGKQGLRYVKDYFTLEAMVNKTESLYLELLFPKTGSLI